MPLYAFLLHVDTINLCLSKNGKKKKKFQVDREMKSFKIKFLILGWRGIQRTWLLIFSPFIRVGFKQRFTVMISLDD